MKSYLITEKQFKRVIESESPETHFDDEKMIKLIQNYLDNIITPSTNLICKSMVYRYVETGDYFVRVWVNQNEPHTQDDSDEVIDLIWESVWNMFGITLAIHRVKSEC